MDRHKPGERCVLRASGVVKRYGRRTVLDGVDFHVAAGEAVAVVGENGAGKSTLVRICAGALRSDPGRVEVDGRIGYCPQEPGVLDLLKPHEHLVLFGRGLGLGPRDAITRGRHILDRLHFASSEQTLARNLSGGNRQKLNLALALLGDPELLLLDEPYQGFDHGTYIDFWGFVDQWRQEGRGVAIVTHMLAELPRVDRVFELAATPGDEAQ